MELSDEARVELEKTIFAAAGEIFSEAERIAHRSRSDIVSKYHISSASDNVRLNPKGPRWGDSFVSCGIGILGFAAGGSFAAEASGGLDQNWHEILLVGCGLAGSLLLGAGLALKFKESS